MTTCNNQGYASRLPPVTSIGGAGLLLIREKKGKKGDPQFIASRDLFAIHSYDF